MRRREKRVSQCHFEEWWDKPVRQDLNVDGRWGGRSVTREEDSDGGGSAAKRSNHQRVCEMGVGGTQRAGKVQRKAWSLRDETGSPAFVIALCGIFQKHQGPCEAGGRPNLGHLVSFAKGSGLLPARVALFSIGLKYMLALIRVYGFLFLHTSLFLHSLGGVKSGGSLSLAEFNSRDVDPCSVTYKLAGLGQICFRALSQEC